MESQGSHHKTDSAADQRAGKYLTFVLAEEEYGFEILKVREINGMMDITAIPRMPDYVEGVINLRGKVIPIVDLRLKFGMSKAELSSETCVIVVDVKGTLMGVIVDRVSEVLDISSDDIEDAPRFGTAVDTEFIMGMAKAKGCVKILLDIHKVLSDTDYSGLELSAAMN
jgi:purine-binding chemotaxis protein CheW